MTPDKIGVVKIQNVARLDLNGVCCRLGASPLLHLDTGLILLLGSHNHMYLRSLYVHSYDGDGRTL